MMGAISERKVMLSECSVRRRAREWWSEGDRRSSRPSKRDRAVAGGRRTKRPRRPLSFAIGSTHLCRLAELFERSLRLRRCTLAGETLTTCPLSSKTPGFEGDPAKANTPRGRKRSRSVCKYNQDVMWHPVPQAECAPARADSQATLRRSVARECREVPAGPYFSTIRRRPMSEIAPTSPSDERAVEFPIISRRPPRLTDIPVTSKIMATLRAKAQTAEIPGPDGTR